jgi:hypothetical protein
MKHKHILNVCGLLDDEDRVERLKGSRIVVTVHPNQLDNEPVSALNNPIDMTLTPELASAVLCNDADKSYLAVLEKRHGVEARRLTLPQAAVRVTFAYSGAENVLLCLSCPVGSGSTTIYGMRRASWDTAKLPRTPKWEQIPVLGVQQPFTALAGRAGQQNVIVAGQNGVFLLQLTVIAGQKKSTSKLHLQAAQLVDKREASRVALNGNGTIVFLTTAHDLVTVPSAGAAPRVLCNQPVVRGLALTSKEAVLAVGGRLLFWAIDGSQSHWMLQQAAADENTFIDDEATQCRSCTVAAICAWHDHIEFVDSELLAIRHVYSGHAIVSYLRILAKLVTAAGMRDAEVHISPATAMPLVTDAATFVVALEGLQQSRRLCITGQGPAATISNTSRGAVKALAQELQRLVDNVSKHESYNMDSLMETVCETYFSCVLRFTPGGVAPTHAQFAEAHARAAKLFLADNPATAGTFSWAQLKTEGVYAKVPRRRTLAVANKAVPVHVGVRRDLPRVSQQDITASQARVQALSAVLIQQPQSRVRSHCKANGNAGFYLTSNRIPQPLSRLLTEQVDSDDEMGTAAPPPAATQAAGGEESLDGAAVDAEEVPLDLARPLIAVGDIVAVLPNEQAHGLFWLAKVLSVDQRREELRIHYFEREADMRQDFLDPDGGVVYRLNDTSTEKLHFTQLLGRTELQEFWGAGSESNGPRLHLLVSSRVEALEERALASVQMRAETRKLQRARTGDVRAAQRRQREAEGLPQQRVGGRRAGAK